MQLPNGQVGLVWRSRPFRPLVQSVKGRLRQTKVGHGEERKARLEKMVATTQLKLALIKGMVDMGVVLSPKPILKSCQLCLSFKLDVHRHPHLKEI